VTRITRVWSDALDADAFHRHLSKYERIDELGLLALVSILHYVVCVARNRDDNVWLCVLIADWPGYGGVWRMVSRLARRACLSDNLRQ